MIKFKDQVPSVYSSASRDFQYLGWLIDIVLNSVKHNVDDLYNLPNSTADTRLTELLAMTLGFKVKRNYDQDQLRALVAIIPRILKYKGTRTAVEMAGRALVAASGTTRGEFSIDEDRTKDGELTVILPAELVDISLFMDLLNYILPAGMTCHIIRENKISKDAVTHLVYNEDLLAEWIPDLDWTETKSEQSEQTEQTFPGLANMFDVPGIDPVLSNYVDYNKDLPNVGLLNNSVIPVISDTMLHTTAESTPKKDPTTLYELADDAGAMED